MSFLNQIIPNIWRIQTELTTFGKKIIAEFNLQMQQNSD